MLTVHGAHYKVPRSMRLTCKATDSVYNLDLMPPSLRTQLRHAAREQPQRLKVAATHIDPLHLAFRLLLISMGKSLYHVPSGPLHYAETW